MPILKNVIVSKQSKKGDGTPLSAKRRITEVFDIDGKFIAERDPFGNYTMEEVLEFAEQVRAKNGASIADCWKEWKKATPCGRNPRRI